MPAQEKEHCWTHSEFEAVPGLVHGFGKAGCTATDFLEDRTAGSGDWAVLKLKQVHSDGVQVIRRPPRASLTGDAAVTSLSRLILTIRTADCLPVFLVAPESHVIAAIHCGWRSTVLGLSRKVVETIQDVYNTPPVRLKAVLGPAIERECYEVGEDVRAAWLRKNSEDDPFKPLSGRPGKYLFDLKAANREQLHRAGLPPASVHAIPACTRCDPGLLSYRRSPGTAHRLLNAIAWRE